MAIKNLKKHWALIALALFLVSPAMMFYFTKGYYNLFTPIFVFFQFSVILLVAQLLKRRLFLVVFAIPMILLTVFQWVHFLMFGAQLSEGAVAAILSTNSSETLAFVGLVPDGVKILVAVFVLVTIYLLSRLPAKTEINRRVTSILVVAVTLTLVLRTAKHRDLYAGVVDSFLTAHPFYSLVSIAEGAKLLHDYRQRLSSHDTLKISIDKNVQFQKETHVLVIGESARRVSWELYGYARPTNSFTRQYRFFLFKDVVSIANSTIPALYNMLTYSEGEKITTLMDLASDAGFKVFWLSNQQQFGVYDNPTSVLAQRADFVEFVNGLDGYDINLLPSITKAIQSPEPRKLIMIHIMGSHGYHHQRYPSTFARFKECHDTEEVRLNTKVCSAINDYDNSILYTDFILSEILKVLEDEEGVTSLTYFSDHGENVHAGEGVVGHGGGKISKTEVEVPFALWFSDHYKSQRSSFVKRVEQSLDRPMSFLDFLPTYLSILGLEVELKNRFNVIERDPMRERYILGPDGKKVLYRNL